MLESLIRTLLSSFRESHKSLPTPTFVSSETSIQVGIDGLTPFTAPSDGYLVIQAVGQVAGLTLRADQDFDWTSNATSTGTWLCLNAPVRKGQTVYFWASSNDSSSAYIYQRFYQTIGAS